MTKRKRFNYLDDLKALPVQGERGFWNRVDKVVHGDHKPDTARLHERSPVKREREREEEIKRGPKGQEKSLAM